MASDFAAMLDEMMGPERNIDLDKVTGKRRRFDDEDVDRHFLVGCSPYQLFQGSKKNIGYLDEFARHVGMDPARNSRMVCDEACKAEYEALPQTEKDRLGWERDTFFLLGFLIKRCDDRVRNAREQLEAHARRVEDKVAERKVGWQTRIDAKMRASEEAGEAGLVDECQKLIAEANAVRAASEKDLEQYRKEQSRGTDHQKVCPVSGAIVTKDATPESDTSGHYAGRNYVGWKKIREWHAAHAAQLSTRPPRSPFRSPRGPAADGRRGTGPSPPRTSREWDRERDRETRRGDERRGRDGSRERDDSRDRGRRGGDGRRGRDGDRGRRPHPYARDRSRDRRVDGGWGDGRRGRGYDVYDGR